MNVYGFPTVGKTTLIKDIARKFPKSFICDTDHLYKSFFPGKGQALMDDKPFREEVEQTILALYDVVKTEVTHTFSNWWSLFPHDFFEIGFVKTDASAIFDIAMQRDEAFGEYASVKDVEKWIDSLLTNSKPRLVIKKLYELPAGVFLSQICTFDANMLTFNLAKTKQIW